MNLWRKNNAKPPEIKQVKAKVNIDITQEKQKGYLNRQKRRDSKKHLNLKTQNTQD